MKTVYFFLLFLLLSTKSNSQESFGFQVGIGTFNMSDFKEINENIQKFNLPFEAKITNNFPMNMVYKVFYHHSFNHNFGIGIKYSFSSTGSIISREDYSGSYYFKNQVYYTSPGFVFDYCIFSFPKYKILIYDELGWQFSQIKMHENFTFSDQIFEDINKYRSTNIFNELGVKAIYPYNEIINIGCYIGYLLDSNGGIKEANSLFELKELIVLNSGSTYSNWAGLRLGLSFSMNISNLF